jgi:hypothetical protein
MPPSNNPTITLAVGLPGSGKSTYIASLLRNQPDLFVAHDFKKETRDGTAQFTSSRHFEELIAALRSGRDAALDDIGFCHPEARKWAERDIRAALQNADGAPSIDITFNWVFFENDPIKCEANIRRRAQTDTDRDLEKELAYLKKHGPNYVLPELSKPLKIWELDPSCLTRGTTP